MCDTVNVSKLSPRIPGYYIFKGIRFQRNNQRCRVHEPVEVVEVWLKGKKELAIALAGISTRARMETFEGEWTRLELEAA